MARSSAGDRAIDGRAIWFTKGKRGDIAARRRPHARQVEAMDRPQGFGHYRLQSRAPLNRVHRMPASLTLRAIALSIGAGCFAPLAAAQDTSFHRVLACRNENARVEVYLPSPIAVGRVDRDGALRKPVAGWYILDLTEIGKGKPLEPVRITLGKDGQSLIVDQFTRKLPPTAVPFAGGVLSFDRRFAEEMTCTAYGE